MTNEELIDEYVTVFVSPEFRPAARATLAMILELSGTRFAGEAIARMAVAASRRPGPGTP